MSRATEQAGVVLARAKLPAPAYAVALWGVDDEILEPGWVCIGLEPDRVAALAGPHPRRQIWVVSDYRLSFEVSLRADDAFVAAEQQAWAALEAVGVWDPQRWVLNRVAKALGERRPLTPVTDDFVVFAFADAFGADLTENLRFSAGPAFAPLEQRGFLPRAQPAVPRAMRSEPGALALPGDSDSAAGGRSAVIAAAQMHGRGSGATARPGRRLSPQRVLRW